MKIVILNQYCLPCFAPTGRVAYLLGKELADRGHKVTIIISVGVMPIGLSVAWIIFCCLNKSVPRIGTMICVTVH